jgi:hypothetical protein
VVDRALDGSYESLFKSNIDPSVDQDEHDISHRHLQVRFDETWYWISVSTKQESN